MPQAVSAGRPARWAAMLAAGVGLAASFGCATAQAADDKPVAVAFNVGANNDYVFRGISQTDHNPSVFGGADLTFLGVGYAGTWISNVDFGNGTDLEYDFYAGVRPAVGPVTLDVGLMRYGYTGSPSGSHQDYWEGKAAASIPAGPAILGVAVYYTPESFGKSGDAVYYELNGSTTLPNSRFSVSGALGRQEVRGPADFTTWNIGVGYALNDRLGFDLRYSDTDRHRLGKIYDSRVVAGVKLTF